MAGEEEEGGGRRGQWHNYPSWAHRTDAAAGLLSLLFGLGEDACLGLLSLPRLEL